MTQLGRWIGLILAAGTLAGCLPARPPLPDLRTDPKHPFPEEQRPADKTPAIQKTSFAPPDFPQERFEASQNPPLQPMKQVTPPPPPVVAPPPEVIKREPLADAVQCILEKRHDEAVRHLQAYDPETQDWFLRLLPALSILTRKKIQELDAAEVAVLHEQLHTLVAALRPKAELTVSKACYCEWIKSYGDYKPLPDGYAFASAGAARPGECVQLYVELRNFASEPRGGQFETRFSSSAEIRDSKGVMMWSHRFEDEKHTIRSRTQLQDYYSSYSFPVPLNMPPGVHTLVIQIADETNPNQRRMVRKALEFRVAAAPVRVASP